ncbi:MAG: adenosylcobinamide amidohydrolase [Desulfobacterales bacterium]
MNTMIFNMLRICFLLWIAVPASCFSFPVTFTDARGKPVTLQQEPRRVVSLVPSVTEVLFKIGAGNSVKGMTYHSGYLSGASDMDIVGGFFEPSLSAIEKIQPDLIVVDDIHEKVMERFAEKECVLVAFKTSSISDSFENIQLLGKIFNREEAASGVIEEIQQELAFISKKISVIPKEERKRVIRLMGREKVMTPGIDSFQNEMIRAAGGISHNFERSGEIIEVKKEEWLRFNPQVIYGCGGDQKTAEKFFSQPGWKDVEAVKTGSIYYFPCDLTCRASTNTGYFVSWLAARTYGDEFSKAENRFFGEDAFKTENLAIDLDFVKDIRIVHSRIFDFINKTLIIDFRESMSVISTLEGQRRNINTVGNHYSSPQYWAVGHQGGLKGHQKRVYDVLQQSEKDACFLFTAADMDNLAITNVTFKELAVYALVTAGVESNAMRMAKDQGSFYEPGTINMIIMTNMKLTPRAMTRAIISATEAKTSALLDMDIRSSYHEGAYRATGTGTDNIIVVEGTGVQLDNSGGHTKLGELIARSVYDGVQKAVRMQNGLTASRNIFQRLKERNITIYGLISKEICDCGRDRSDFTGAVEAILLHPRYAGFIQSSLALSDDYEKGLVRDLTQYNDWAKSVAEEIAEQEIDEIREIARTENMPRVIGISLNAICNGVYYRGKK